MISRIQCFADVYLSWRMLRSVAPVNAVDIECFEARHTAAACEQVCVVLRYVLALCDGRQLTAEASQVMSCQTIRCRGHLPPT